MHRVGQKRFGFADLAAHRYKPLGVFEDASADRQRVQLLTGLSEAYRGQELPLELE